MSKDTAGRQFVMNEEHVPLYGENYGKSATSRITMGHLEEPNYQDRQPSGSIVMLQPGRATYTGKLHPNPDPTKGHTQFLHDPGNSEGRWQGQPGNELGYVPEQERLNTKNYQMPMFRTSWSAPKIKAMAATKDDSHAIPSLLGAAALESHARYGQYPEADDDLSPHSAPIVKRLVDKGLVKNPMDDGEDVHASNNVGHHWGDNAVARSTEEQNPDGQGSPFMHTTPYPHANIGSQFIRQALRGNKPKPSFQAGKQMSLWGNP